MTATDPPPDGLDPDDLAVHAVLDGEASADERRRVARDPRLRARVEEMRAVANTVGEEPPAPDEEVLARLRATALASLDDRVEDEGHTTEGDAEDPDEGGAGTYPQPASVSPLPPRRARRSLPPLPAVAAVILVLVLVGIGLIASSQSDDDESADASSSAGIADSGGDGGVADASTTDAAASAPGAAPEDDQEESGDDQEGSVGLREGAMAAFPDDDALRQALQTVDPETLDLTPGEAGTTAPPPRDEAIDVETAVARCASVLQASDAAIGEVQASALVDVDGTLLLVLSTPVAATERGPASTRLTVLEAASCVPRFGVQRDP